MNFLGRAVPRTLERILSRCSGIAKEPIVQSAMQSLSDDTSFVVRIWTVPATRFPTRS